MRHWENSEHWPGSPCGFSLIESAEWEFDYCTRTIILSSFRRVKMANLLSQSDLNLSNEDAFTLIVMA